MRKFGAMEGDIRLRLGARIKKAQRWLCIEESRSAPWCFGMWRGGGVCLFTQRMNTRTPTSTVVFFPLISQ